MGKPRTFRETGVQDDMAGNRNAEWKRKRRARAAAWRRLLHLIWYTAPFCFGVYGYLKLWPGRYLDSLYAAVSLYGGSCEAEDLNLWLEAARWWGLAATGSGLIWLVRPLRDKALRLWISACKGTIIYGSGFYAEKLAEDISMEEGSFPKRILLIQGDQASPAGRQILMRGPGTENLLFYEKNRDIFKGSQVYLNLETILPSGAMPDEVNVFSISENIARLYWKQYPVFLCHGEDNSTKREIGLIGFDNLGQNLLAYGLLRNIYSEDQELVYHVWGAENQSFSRLHRIFEERNGDALFPDGTKDQVIFHEEDWDSSQGLAVIRSLHRLIFCQDHENSKNLTRLLFLLSDAEIWEIGEEKPGIHVKLGGGEACGLAGEIKGAVRFFGRYEEAVTKEYIIREALLKEAKELHWQYANRAGQEKTEFRSEKEYRKAVEAAWKRLPSFFDRYSNIAAADYGEVLQCLLRECEREDGTVADTDMERLAALEHIRWCRFHWWNNWTLDERLEKRSERERKHPWLGPYRELPKKEQQYDLEQVKECLRNLGERQETKQKEKGFGEYGNAGEEADEG